MPCDMPECSTRNDYNCWNVVIVGININSIRINAKDLCISCNMELLSNSVWPSCNVLKLMYLEQKCQGAKIVEWIPKVYYKY